MTTVIVKSARPIIDVSGSELIEHLLQRADSLEQVAEDTVEILRVLEVS